MNELDLTPQRRPELHLKPPWMPAHEVENAGSTARDYLARERNWLAWFKLSATLSLVGSAFAMHLSLGTSAGVPKLENRSAAIPLAALFFVASLAGLGVAVRTFFTGQLANKVHLAFVRQPRSTKFVELFISCLVFSSCVVLIVNSYRTLP